MEKMKTLTIGGVTYAVCAPLTEEEKQEVTQRVLDGISYEEILAPHKEEIADQVAQDIKAGLDIAAKTLRVEDFAIGRVKSDGSFDANAANLAATPALLKCTVDEPYSVRAMGDSTVTVYYYGSNAEYLGKVSGLSQSEDVCRSYTGRQADIAYVRFVVNYHGNTSPVTKENLADVVNQFAFVCYYSDPMVKQSQLSGFAKTEEVDSLRREMEKCAGGNLIYTKPGETKNGITITNSGDVGQYQVTASAECSLPCTIAIYEDTGKLPANILRGHTYRIGKHFPDGVNMQVVTYHGATKLTTNAVSKDGSKSITIPENATGMHILLYFSPGYDYNGKEIRTEMFPTDSVRYLAEKMGVHKAMKVLALGDSITAGSNGFSWVEPFLEKCNAQLVANVAVSGAVLADGKKTQSGEAVPSLRSQVDAVCDGSYEAPDVIIIAVGTNAGIHITKEDMVATYFDGNDLRLLKNVDTTTDAGAFRYASETLHNHFEDATVFWCSPIHAALNSSRKPEEVCAWHESLRIATAYTGQQHIDTIHCGIFGVNDVMRNEEGKYVEGEYFMDGLHPNKKGAKKLGYYIASRMNTAIC